MTTFPSATRWVIRNTGGPAGAPDGVFWSNDQGWVDLTDATIFTGDDPIDLNLPVDGEWVNRDALDPRPEGDSEPAVYLAPNGYIVCGTYDKLTARANIVGIRADGEPEYEGGSEVFWDDQKTIENHRGQPLFLCESGHEWTFDQLVKTDAESV